MAGRRGHAQAVGLVLLFVMSSWLSLVAPATEPATELDAENAVLQVGQGDSLNLTLTTSPNLSLIHI